MKKKKKWIYGLAAGISLVVIAAAVAIAFLLSPSNVYSRKINEAEKLVEEGEPEQMTLFEFQADQEKEEKRQENLRKRERLDEALGKIRKKYGDDAVRKGYKE